MTTIADLRLEVAKSCNILGRLKLTREPNGHVSARIPGSDRMVLKARGPSEAALSYVQPDDLAIVDMDGKLVEGREGLASPAEVFIHTQVYRARPDVNCVIHIHPPNIVAFTIAEKPLLPVIGAYNPAALRLITAGLPVYPRSILINSPARGDELAGYLGAAGVCLMRGHGITAAASTIEDATMTIVHLNDLAELHYKADLLGGAKPIPEEDIADLAGFNLGAVAKEEVLPRLHGAEWRYYERLLLGDS